MKYDLTVLGTIIRNERTRRGWTQDTLLSEMSERGNGIGRNTLSRLENGEVNEIKFSHILTLCDIYRCDIGYLLGAYPEKEMEINICSEYTGLTENTLKSLHDYHGKPESSFISSFLDYLLDYINIFDFLIKFEQYISPEKADGYICDSSGKHISIFTDDLKAILTQQAFKDFLSFASDKKSGTEHYSKSKEREDYEKYTLEQKKEFAAEYLKMLKEGK